MEPTEIAEKFGSVVMEAANAWLDANEKQDADNGLVGVVIAVSPQDDEGASFVVGATHTIENDIIVEILLHVVNKLVPPEARMQLVIEREGE